MPFYEFQKLYLLKSQVQEDAQKGMEKVTMQVSEELYRYIHKNGEGFSKDGQTLTEKRQRIKTKMMNICFTVPETSQTNLSSWRFSFT